METTTINKSLTEALSSTGFVKIEASRKESEPFQHRDAYIYDAGTRIGYASADRNKRLSFFQESPDSLTGEEWISAYTKVQNAFDKILNKPVTE